MANTYSQIYIQLVFAVRGRESLIDKLWREELFKYISGIFENKGVKLLAIGGVEDHIHILFSLPVTLATSDLVRDVKASSSKWVNDRRLVHGHFAWQEGFGAFSYSRSHIDTVAKYVLNQESHHSQTSFKDEYLTLLKRFEIEHDERYVFEWMD
jgi:REP element-mobilizing transposase RayT